MMPNEIKQLRVRLGWTQERLAHELGVSWTTVNRWENGKAKPSPLAEERLKTLQAK